MDAHYHKVMKAREGITDKATKMYFAYSGVLDREAFEAWRDEHSYHFFELPEGKLAKAVGLDLVFDFPSRWWGGRVLGLLEKPGSEVFGRLFEIPAINWPVVQHKEGVVTGMSVEKKVKVSVDGQEFEAIAFTTNPERVSLEGPVSPRYVEAWTRGAQSSGLPVDYISKVTGLAAHA